MTTDRLTAAPRSSAVGKEGGRIAIAAPLRVTAVIVARTTIVGSRRDRATVLSSLIGRGNGRVPGARAPTGGSSGRRGGCQQVAEALGVLGVAGGAIAEGLAGDGVEGVAALGENAK